MFLNKGVYYSHPNKLSNQINKWVKSLTIMKELNNITELELRDFLSATDKYIDTLEEENDDLHFIVDDQDKANNELTKWVVKSIEKAKAFRLEIEALKKENMLLKEEEEHAVMQWELKADELTDMFKLAERLDKDLESARVEIIELKAAASKDFTETMIAGQQEDKDNSYNEYIDLWYNNMSISNHKAAYILGVSVEDIIKYKCMRCA